MCSLPFAVFFLLILFPFFVVGRASILAVGVLDRLLAVSPLGAEP